MSVLTKILTVPYNFPIVRGMVSYALIWPTCSIVQEYLEHGKTMEKVDWSRAARFGVFGTFFMAPVFYGWMKYSGKYFIRRDLITAITRSAIEQITYSPLALAYFFFGMSLLEGKPRTLCLNEVREKFWPTYKIGAVFWPLAQTFNFYFISEKNRIVFASMASFIWTLFLAHVKGKQMKQDFSLIDSLPTQDSSVLRDAGQKITTLLVASEKGPIVEVEDVKESVLLAEESNSILTPTIPERIFDEDITH